MQKSIRLIGVVLCVAIMASAFFGCGADISEADVQTVLDTALQNSLSADLFYWKETDNRDDVSRYSQVNVLSDIDSKTYTPLVDENGNYTTLRIQVLRQEDGNTVYQSVCGESSGVEEGDEVRSYLFETTADSTGETVQTKTPMTAAEYYESAQFQPYGLQSKLQVSNGATSCSFSSVSVTAFWRVTRPSTANRLCLRAPSECSLKLLMRKFHRSLCMSMKPLRAAPCTWKQKLTTSSLCISGPNSMSRITTRRIPQAKRFGKINRAPHKQDNIGKTVPQSRVFRALRHGFIPLLCIVYTFTEQPFFKPAFFCGLLRLDFQYVRKRTALRLRQCIYDLKYVCKLL